MVPNFPTFRPEQKKARSPPGGTPQFTDEISRHFTFPDFFGLNDKHPQSCFAFA